jgi:hypothetical protein
MMQVYDLRGDVGAGTSSRCSAALRVLYSLKSMTWVRIRACTRGSFLDEEDRSRHGGLYGVVTYFTGSPECGGHCHRIETLAAWAPHRLHTRARYGAAQAPKFPSVKLDRAVVTVARYASDLATLGHAQKSGAARIHPVQGSQGTV